MPPRPISPMTRWPPNSSKPHAGREAGGVARRQLRLLARAAEFTLDNEQRASRLLRAAGCRPDRRERGSRPGEPRACAPGPSRPATARPSSAARGRDRVPRLAPWTRIERGDAGADGQDRLDDARCGASVRAAGRASRSRCRVRRDPDGGLLRRHERRSLRSRSRGSRGRSSFPAGTTPSVPIWCSTPSPN